MALTITDIKYEPRILDGKHRISIKEKTGLDIPAEFTISVTDIGDATAGAVTGVLDFSSYLPNKQLYVCLTSILTFTSPPLDFLMYIESDRWKNFYARGHADLSMTIFNADSIQWGLMQRDMLNGYMLYLGEPNYLDADAGKITFYWPTNTESQVYNLIIQGFQLTQPLPLNTLCQKCPI